MRSIRLVLMLVALGAVSCDRNGASKDTAAGKIDMATIDQGWSADDRELFYTTTQGSHIMPARWFSALQRADGQGHFAADQLARYGYLPTQDGSKLPVGFVVDQESGDLGMTCAACHTGQIAWKGRLWRIDGGRANADFQGFLTDLVAAARATVADRDRLSAFATEAAGSSATPQDIAEAKRGFVEWTAGVGTFMDSSLPMPAWGAGRLDAFGMIFNRLTALDLGIASNYGKANAPVRYPFLWNAALQDRTQWDGAAPNGSFVKAMARNTGEVFGVFGHFDPTNIGPAGISPHLVLYASSVEFRNLQVLEEEIKKLKAPAWPQASFGLDDSLVTHGKDVFDGNCAACHAERPSGSVAGAWATPVCRVGTDPTMYENALLTADAGRLGGTLHLSEGGLLPAHAQKVEILANAVIGSLILDAGAPDTGVWRAINADAFEGLARGAAGEGSARTTQAALPVECRSVAAAAAPTTPTTDAPRRIGEETKDLYRLPVASSPTRFQPGTAAYESRVLNGIWAAPPYLHNGSVGSLAELLMPAAARSKVLPLATQDYDPVKVGVAAAPVGIPTQSTDTLGNSNAGHEYGTSLLPGEKRALLEYLKTL